MKIYGFTILRNGLKYDYPFLESLRSLSALCEEVVVALGNSDDGTEEKLKEFSNLVIVPTVWDENLRKSGLILSMQTNIALQALRDRHQSGWGVYLQADEVLSERDFARIRSDMAEADSAGCDALSFRYLHFWQAYDRIAVDWRWYPQEIRAIRLDSQARSYGDAQSFEGVKNRFESDAFVYHYGHVREALAYERKKSDFNRWWHSDEEMVKVLKKGARRDRHEQTLPFYGPHPSFMRERIGDSAAGRKKALVFGKPEEHPGIEERVEAELEWTDRFSQVLARPREETVLLDPPPFWARILGFRSLVPDKMRSPQARPWTKEFQDLLKFSEKGIHVR